MSPAAAGAPPRAHTATARRREFTLDAAAGEVDLGGLVVPTWSYGGEIPGPAIRVGAGEEMRVRVVNNLPAPTTAHWHGVQVPNDQDGVPDLTQPPIAPGAEFTYRFAPPLPGTYWVHPHVGVQQDRGLYAPLIVDDPREPLAYDDEWVVVLDDWIDGTGTTPDDVLAALTGGRGGAHGAAPAEEGAHAAGPRGTGASSPLLGGHAGDVPHPYHLLNGRLATAPRTFAARAGTRVRLRVVNAGSDTAYRVALGGHRMTVTHADGLPVDPADTACLLLGMGERYDALVTLGSGVFPLVAVAEGKNGAALGIVRTATGTAPGPDVRPAELDTPPLDPYTLTADDSVRLAAREPDRVVRLELTVGPGYGWGINGRAYRPGDSYTVRQGERVRLEFVNRTGMWHPMHAHGHAFAVGGGAGALKDTANVMPGRTVRVDLDAGNPGLWMVHCHNVYHSEAGMMTVLSYA